MSNDEKVLDTIKQLIKEVKEEMKTKKVLSEGKTAEEVFSKQERDSRKYITEVVLKTLNAAEK